MTIKVHNLAMMWVVRVGRDFDAILIVHLMTWGTTLELAGNELQVVWNLDAGLEEEKLQIASFVLKLHLASVL